jgi:hypothetical protein
MISIAYASLVLKEKAVRLQYIQAVKTSLDEHGDHLDMSGLRVVDNTSTVNSQQVNNATEAVSEEILRSINVAEPTQTSSQPSPLDATNYAP